MVCRNFLVGVRGGGDRVDGEKSNQKYGSGKNFF